MITAIKMLFFFTFLTGIVYPIFVTGISQVLFHSKANGSFIFKGEKEIGSELIGQNFTSDKYFKSRPSSVNYDPQISGATNFSVTSNKFQDSLKIRREKVKSPDLLMASASGLDPHITPEATLEQVDRVLQARGLGEAQKEKLIELISTHTEGKTLGLMGMDRVNVLKLNSRLDDFL